MARLALVAISSKCLIPAGGALLQPGNILVVWRRDVELKVKIIFGRRDSAWVAPFVNFGVTVGEIEPAGAIVVAGREINNVTAGALLIHCDNEISVVDAFLAFVNEDPRFGRAWVEEIREPMQDL